MEIIKFDGWGKPKKLKFGTGTIALLLQDSKVSVVRVELLPPEEFGPALESATNQDELELLAMEAINKAFPNGLSRSRHWLLECPKYISEIAKFNQIER